MGLYAPPVRDYDGRKTLRSLADALVKFRKLDNLSDDETVIIKTWPVELFDGRRTGCVNICRPPRADGSIFVVLMRSSGTFSALTTLGERIVCPIGTLADATSDSDGNVQLANGQFFHGVDLMPVPFYATTPAEDAIIRLALKFLGVEDRCYRSIDPSLLPGVEVLDYGRIPGIRVDRLKPVWHYVSQRLPDVSRSAVVSALKRAGMRLPRTAHSKHTHTRSQFSHT